MLGWSLYKSKAQDQVYERKREGGFFGRNEEAIIAPKLPTAVVLVIYASSMYPCIPVLCECVHVVPYIHIYKLLYVPAYRYFSFSTNGPLWEKACYHPPSLV